MKRFPPIKCWAYLIAAFLPACWGVGGTVTGAMSAFATLKTAGAGDPAKFHGALWEITLPITAGFFCSAVLMTLAVFIWLRGQVKHEYTPV